MQEMKKNRQFLWFISITACLTGIFLILFSMDGHMGQDQVFFGKTGDYMADYTNVIRYSDGRNPYFYSAEPSAEQAYPPLAYCIFGFLGKLAGYGTIYEKDTMNRVVMALFFTFIVGIYFAQLDLASKDLKKWQKAILLILLFFSGVNLMSFERGNIIYLAVATLWFYLLNYQSENKVIREIALISLAVSAALKGMPALFGILLIYDRRWKDTVRCLIYGIVVCFGPFLILKGDLISNIQRWIANMHAMNTGYYLYGRFPRFGYLYYLSNMEEGAARDTWNSVLKVVTIILCLIAIYLAKNHGLRKWEIHLLLISVIVFITVNSAYYTGLYILPVICEFLACEGKKNYDFIFLIGFILIVNPLQIIIGDYNYTNFISNTAWIVLWLSMLGIGIFREWNSGFVYRIRKGVK